MTIRDELVALKKEREDLLKRKNEFCATLEDLNVEKDMFAKKVETLSERSSSLARRLYEKAKKELESINACIANTEKEKAGVENKLEENQRKITLREDDTTLYIETQSSRMIAEFMDYIGKHLEEIGEEVEKTFRIAAVTSHVSDRYGDYYVPTGNICIYDVNTSIDIVSSKDFHFQKNLYTTARGEYDTMFVKSTEWYQKYFGSFVSHLLELLRMNFNYSEFFNLIIEGGDITLELV